MMWQRMKWNRFLCRICTGCSILLFLGGCVKASGINRKVLSMPLLTDSGALQPSGAIHGLPRVKLLLGRGRLDAEIASTPLQAAKGLSFRAALAPDGGMLFTYQIPHRVVYHMKDTSIPLSIAYIDSMGVVLETHESEPGDETPIVSASNDVSFVLEVNRGWFEKNGVIPGMPVFAGR